MSKTKKHEQPVLAIDVGGTTILSAIVSNEGQVVANRSCLTLADDGPQTVIDRIYSSIDHLLEVTGLDLPQLGGISIASAGIIDMDKGIITVSPNLPGWHDIHLRDIVKEKYGIDTFLVNDASAAALGEHHFGAGRAVDNLVYLTVSTGIGGGIITNGKLYVGTHGSAGEIGHMIIDVNGPECSCGNRGCLEALASGSAIAREAKERIRQGRKSSLTDIAKGKIEDITAEEVGAAAQDGDPLALEVVSEAATHLGMGIINVIHIFNPEIIIIGGGVAKMGDLLFNPVRQVVSEKAFSFPAQAVRIVPPQLGEDPGLIGAAIFAFQYN